ncbi:MULTISPECIES: hypothetical protein [Pseudomonas]|uniref:hypothetical protein n=1 Tax=Pseudomonas TaxID=286 RepID=UPI0010C11CC4|nr:MULTISPECIES: hypothetical protein [Pseudomonas]MBJ2223191.1 hypothetical protein [Pseudomonas sp. MF7451]MCI0915507.1 hypothetical protein [Pseudomonas putida]HEE9765069.1 hypothetical protein [Pseudomonas putida]HEE9790722.1 hypothetical protein [Enterobacter soli]
MEQEKSTKKIKVTREIFEHNYLGSIALNQLAQARNEQDGHRFRWILPSMAFSVFRVEAICNVYGRKLFSHWDHFESTSFIGKITMISEFLKIEVKFSEEPWQTLNLMKSFRNALAHAKPQKAFEIHEVAKDFPHKLLPYPKSKKTILSYSSIENAERFDEVATRLEVMWMHNARVLNFLVDTSGRPEFTEV